MILGQVETPVSRIKLLTIGFKSKTPAVETIENEHYRLRLRRTLIARQKRNPGYSLRSFARDLKISPATLSQVISAKRNLSKGGLLKVADRLSFTPKETTKALKDARLPSPVRDDVFLTLQDDVFKYMSDWYYFAILSLASAGHAMADSSWIAERFGISTIQANDAIERLIRLKLIQTRNGKLVYSGQPLKTNTDFPSSAARALQHNHLSLAQVSLERDPLQMRDMTSMTMAIRLERIPQAKKMIKRFRRRLMQVLEADGKGEDVFVFALQLFPVTKLRNGK